MGYSDHMMSAIKKPLEESEQKIKALLDTIMDPVYICSCDHEIQYSNSAFQSFKGNSVLENKCYAAVFDSERKCKDCPTVESLAEESLTKQIEISVDNEPRFFKVSVSPIKFHKGTISRLHILKDVTELIQARDHASSNEKKIKLVADNSIDMVWQMDLRLKFTYLSPSAVAILGYPMEDMMGHKLWEFTKRKEFMKMARYAIGAIKDYKNFSTITFETLLVHKEGHEIPVEITGKLLKNEAGKAIGLQGSTRDITERFEAQSVQEKQYNLLRTLIDNIPDTIYAKDLSGRYILNNTGHQKELKVLNQDQILNKSDYDFYDQETAGEFYRDEQKIIDSGISMINKEEYKSYGDGSHRWTLTTKVPIRDPKGAITGIAGINRDITDRKIIEEELFRSRYELALRNKIANIFLTSETDRLFQDVLQIILAESKSSTGFFGYINERQELVCPTMSEEFSGNDPGTERPYVLPKDSWEGIWGDSLLEKKVIFSNKPLQLPHGHSPVQNVLCVPIFIKEELLGQICMANKPGGYIEKDQQIMESIALYIAPILRSYLKEKQMKEAKEEAFHQLKAAKEKAEESDKLKSAFLLNLSHELRTPLNALLGFSSVLAGRSNGDTSNAFYMEQIQVAGNDLMKMIEDTIEMSKLESGLVDLDPMKQEIGKTLCEIENDFKHSYSDQYPDIEFCLLDSTHGIALNTDHGKIKTAIKNILDNAVKFTIKGKIELGGNRVNGSILMLYVKDTGIGIPKELHKAVFEKFRKIENKNTLYRGNGLGLSISKGLVERIGGSISIESTPGIGTQVNIYLPLESSPGGAPII